MNEIEFLIASIIYSIILGLIIRKNTKLLTKLSEYKENIRFMEEQNYSLSDKNRRELYYKNRCIKFLKNHIDVINRKNEQDMKRLCEVIDNSKEEIRSYEYVIEYVNKYTNKLHNSVYYHPKLNEVILLDDLTNIGEV